MKRWAKAPQLNAYLTVFLSLSLSVLLGVFLFLIQAALVGHSKMKLECVTDIGMNSVLGEFHRELLEQYDLLFVDLSYGSASGGIAQAQSHLTGFIAENLQTAPYTVSAWNKLKLDEARITATLMAHHYDGKILKRQACAYISENAKAGAVSDVKDLLSEAVKLDAKDEIASWIETMNTIGTLLASLTKTARQEALEADPDADVSGIEVSLDNPASGDFDEAMAMLASFSDDSGGGAITLSDYYSHRGAAVAGPGRAGYEEDIVGKVADDHLFRRYLFEKMGRHMNLKEGSRLDYQIEYIIAGKNSDKKNFNSIKSRIFAWRFADNARLYLESKEKQYAAEAIAKTVTALLLVPELAESVKYALLFSWAFHDTTKDIKTIFDGGKIPLVKESIGSTRNGIDYPQYLELMLLLQWEKNTIARAMDIIEMDIRQTPGNRYFRIDQCMEGFRATINYHDSYEQYTIDRRYGYY